MLSDNISDGLICAEIKPRCPSKTMPTTIPWNNFRSDELGLVPFAQIFWYHELARLLRQTGRAGDPQIGMSRSGWLKSVHGVFAEKESGVKSAAMWGNDLGFLADREHGLLDCWQCISRHVSKCWKQLLRNHFRGGTFEQWGFDMCCMQCIVLYYRLTVSSVFTRAVGSTTFRDLSWAWVIWLRVWKWQLSPLRDFWAVKFLSH